jgi:hypothetical protein
MAMAFMCNDLAEAGGASLGLGRFTSLPPSSEKPERVTGRSGGTITFVPPRIETVVSFVTSSFNSACRKSISQPPRNENDQTLGPGRQGPSPSFEPPKIPMLLIVSSPFSDMPSRLLVGDSSAALYHTQLGCRFRVAVYQEYRV